MKHKPILGAHESISGGLHKAVEAAAAVGCDCVQIFSKNSNQWSAKPLTSEEIGKFRAALDATGVTNPIVHDSYLINLASPDDVLWQKSIDAFAQEMIRADQLGIGNVVMHPGSYTTSTEAAGLERIARGLEEVFRKTDGVKSRCLLENMAGQGTNLGAKIEHLQTIIRYVEGDAFHEADSPKLGICFDTCHGFAAGLDLRTEEKYAAFWQNFENLIGLRRLHAFHLNDSMKDFESRKDRHDHIGRGVLGLDVFRFLLNDPRFFEIPMYLETPKGETDAGEDWDIVNLRTLRGLVE